VTAAIACSALAKSFGGVRAVDGVDFEVGEGEVFALLGPNGAGKTTTIRMVVALLRPDAGQVSLFGRDAWSDVMAARRVFGYVPQQLSADGTLTGHENVELFARLYDVPRTERRRRVDEAIALVALEDAAGRTVKTYSGGMVRRLELAQALVNRPRLLVLDEPTIGLDPVARGDFWQRLLALRDEAGTSILVTTHYLEEADRYCERVGLMHRGRLRAIGAPAELKAQLGPGAGLEDVFRHHSGAGLEDEGDLRSVRAARRVARRLG
jgi:ABC-2 type transport system ATP-binding protein